MVTKPPTLSRRGQILASQPNTREQASLLQDKYHPDTNPDGWTILGVAENYAMLPTLSRHLDSIRLSADDLSYNEGPWGTQRLRGALAGFINRRFYPFRKVRQEDLCISNGLTPLCSMLGYACCEEGDGSLMSQPYYGSFPDDFGRVTGAKAVMVGFADVDQFSVEAVRCYDRALKEAERRGTRVRALLLCNPHNPLGRCYPRETLMEIMKFCGNYGIHLISDEIYGMSVWEKADDELATPFVSVLSFESSQYIRPDYLHMLYAMSKDLGAGGLRIGCLVSGNKELRLAINQMTFYHWPGIADQRAAITVLEDHEWLDDFLSLSRQTLRKHSQWTKSVLDEKCIKYTRGGNAGFFFLIDLRPFLEDTGKDGWEAEAVLLGKMVSKKVFASQGQMMRCEEPGWFRIVFAQDRDTLQEGMKRMFEALGA